MSANNSKRSVLITGCSDGGLGAALAIAFHEAGCHVYATARNASKMANLKALGIETKELDVLSESSIAKCVSEVPNLDILVNNAGLQMTMTASDTSIPQAKEIFDVNVWAMISMSQAFLPLLVRSKGVLANHTSISSVVAMPLGSAYGASKAAAAHFTAVMRIELKPFGVKVVDLKTGVTGPTNFISNNTTLNRPGSVELLPKDTIYNPARELVETLIRQEGFKDKESGQTGMVPAEWAMLVVQDLLKTNPPYVVWHGQYTILGKLESWLPIGWMNWVVRKAAKWNEVEAILNKNSDQKH
ncbi:putative estradiol 17 beta-dehydrogenase [Lindgomyces ingoldianus]|uniref:Estradiol 17 beta-dehydrogenase n=1 Tax=Lindgomyces ingoldianus TaxID=673940 RepID=A0ACB6Q9J1_9PLEO|nr:putative estradiol 17 beta-dehydrogenase [Lindgomyces ingoldianus]KAF2463576.1 putative estradiol 17 beta-dehydrogenase [Lindgomyces ingoldianus]